MGYLIAQAAGRLISQNLFTRKTALIYMCQAADDNDEGDNRTGLNVFISKNKMSKLFNVSRNSVTRHVQALVEEGWIRPSPKNNWTPRYIERYRKNLGSSQSMPILYEINTVQIHRNIMAVEAMTKAGIDHEKNEWTLILEETNRPRETDWEQLSTISFPIKPPRFTSAIQAQKALNKFLNDLKNLDIANGIDVTKDSILNWQFTIDEDFNDMRKDKDKENVILSSLSIIGDLEPWNMTVEDSVELYLEKLSYPVPGQSGIFWSLCPDTRKEFILTYQEGDYELPDRGDGVLRDFNDSMVYREPGEKESEFSFRGRDGSSRKECRRLAIMDTLDNPPVKPIAFTTDWETFSQLQPMLVNN